MNSGNCIQEECLQRIRELGGLELLGHIISLFHSYVGERVAEARTALRGEDWAALKAAVHPIKSSAGNSGAQKVRDLALQIEELAGPDHQAQLASLLDQMESAFQEACVELSSLGKAMGVPPDGPVAAPSPAPR